MVIGNDYINSCQSNCHTTTTTTFPFEAEIQRIQMQVLVNMGVKFNMDYNEILFKMILIENQIMKFNCKCLIHYCYQQNQIYTDDWFLIH